jgi:hypothetical protein
MQHSFHLTPPVTPLNETHSRGVPTTFPGRQPRYLANRVSNCHRLTTPDTPSGSSTLATLGRELG